MNKWIAEFELEDGDKMPEHMDLEYHGVKLDFHCRPIEKTYEDGLNEAWECMRKIVTTKRFKTISEYYDYLRRIFGTNSANEVLETNSASEAIAKIKEYEEKRKKVEIHVGDEIYSKLTDCKAVIQRIDTWNRYQCFDNKGSQFVIDEQIFNECWVKTGKNYPQIIEILKQMKGDK